MDRSADDGWLEGKSGHFWFGDVRFSGKTTLVRAAWGSLERICGSGGG